MKFIVMLGVLAVLGTVALFVAARIARRPDTVGRPTGALAPCPTTPNCVSSRSDDPKRRLPPIVFSGDADSARARIAAIVGRVGGNIIVETDDYLYAEFRSRVFRFVDDVEFRLDDAGKVIHFRSASRIGRSDYGVNRARMEKIREVFLSP